MSYQNESFGMMDAGYFVPRGDILNWINNLLKLNISKIEVLGSGAIYCQIVDVIHPGKVALNKINWKAKNDYQFINNLKLLQNAFDKIGIKKHVEVEKLAKAKYQDNLEFIQWLKRYYDINCGERGNNYMAEEKRGNVPIDFSFAEKTIVPKTYNGSGATKPTGNVPEKAEKVEKVEKTEKVQKSKPTTSTNLAPKVEQGAGKLKSPRKPEIKSTEQPKKPEIKKTVKTQAVGTKDQDHTQAEPAQRQKEIVIQYQTDPQLEAQLEKAFSDLEEARQVSESHQKKLQQAEMKLMMIKQILGSEDDAAMKISMIQEIYKE